MAESSKIAERSGLISENVNAERHEMGNLSRQAHRAPRVQEESGSSEAEDANENPSPPPQAPQPQPPPQPQPQPPAQNVIISKKRYWVTVGILLAIIGVLLTVIVVGLLFSTGVGRIGKSTCWTKECIGLTSMLKNYQNTSVDPCDDFFEHTCGRLYEHSSNGEALGYTHYRQLVRQVYHIVSTTEKFPTKPNEQMRIFLKQCMNRTAMSGDTFRDLRDDIEKRGGFPFIDPNWDESAFNLSTMLANHMDINRNQLPFLAVEPFNTVINNKSVTVLYVSPGPHFIQHHNLPLWKHREAATWMVKKLLALENRALDEAQFEIDYNETIALETKFATLADAFKISVDTDDISKIKTLSQLAERVPEIDWFKIIKAMIPKGKGKAYETKFLDNVRVHGGGRYYFGENKTLSSMATNTPPKVLANYIVLRRLIDIGVYFYDKDQPKALKYNGHDSPSMYCSSQLAAFFPMPSMNVFIEKSGYNKEILKTAAEMFKNVKKEYADIFNENKHLEPNVRNFLLKKLDAINGSFANEQYFDGKFFLKKMYATLNFKETDSPYQTYMKLFKHRVEQLVDHVVMHTPLNPENLRRFALYAAYQSYGNDFYMNIAYLVNPWMDINFPTYSNYGYIGYVIGHEIGHAFDNFHRKVDEDGKIINHWITKTNESNIEFEKQETCLRDQYSNYMEPGYTFFMNGTVTRLEIAGDHMGIRTAYRAFKKVPNKVILPGFDDATDEQMFFYHFALRQCEVLSPTVNPYYMKRRIHPTSRFRVNGVVQNVPEFSEAFKCSPESKLNPATKCKLY